MTIFINCVHQKNKLLNILTSLHIPKLRYSTYAQKCKPLLHCTESLNRGDIIIYGLQLEDEYNC